MTGSLPFHPISGRANMTVWPLRHPILRSTWSTRPYTSRSPSPSGGGAPIAGRSKNAGQIAVTGEGNPQSYESFRWESGDWSELGVLLGRDEAIPADIDPDGRIVGLSNEDIGRELDCTPHYARTLLSRGLARLAALLGPDFA